MRQGIRSLAHRLARIGFLSRAVHIVSAIYRLPELRRDIYVIHQRPPPAPPPPPPPPPPPIVTDERVTALEGAWRTHLPALLESISAINHRVSGMDQLLRAIPMSLREAKRESLDRHRRLSELERREQVLLPRVAGTDERIAALGAEIASLVASSERDRTAVHGLAPRIAETTAQLAALEGQVRTALERADQSSGTLTYLLGRVEFVRRELMFELRYGSGAGSHEATEGVSPRIVNTAKVDAARKTGLRLNLGSGHIPLDGYINVDLRELPTIDVVSDVEHLPFGDGEVDEIMSAHMLEHFPEEQLRRTLLPYWFRLLRPGGKFRAVVPDAEAMMREYARGRYPYADFREVMFGGQDYDGDFHYNMFTPGSLDEILRLTGFDDVEVVVEGRKNGQCFEFEIVARKPEDRGHATADVAADPADRPTAGAHAA